jgi:hypothetical protein
MLLQGWGDTLRVFPAMPAAWKEATFHDLRAEGGFLVSAVRRGGRTVLVRVTSLAGEPATLRAAIADPEIVSGAPSSLEKLGDGAWRLALAKGATVVIAARGTGAAERTVAPVTADAAKSNPFGLR